MPHKAGQEFFEEKKPWSRRKDFILEYYLDPYLSAIQRVRRPILIVDCCAGPGCFDDGEPGSPIIICERVKQVLTKGSTVDISVRCIESDADLFKSLEQNLSEYEFAAARFGTFSEYLPRIANAAESHSTFLYIDPFAIEGLEWNGLDQVFAQVASGVSVEVLLNFNAGAFVRRGLGTLKRPIPEPDPEIEDTEDVEIERTNIPPIEKLNAAVGGDWWIPILSETNSFPTQVSLIAEGLIDRLRNRFSEVCSIGLKAEDHHTVPKYYLIFASREPLALIFMNEAMLKVKHAGHVTMDLLAHGELASLIFLELADERKARREVTAGVMRRNFCQYSEKEIDGCMRELRQSGHLEPRTGPFNRNTVVWRA